MIRGITIAELLATNIGEDFALSKPEVLAKCELWGYELEGEIVGVAICQETHLRTFWVNSRYRNRRIGTEMLQELSHITKLAVLKKNVKAQRLYERHGFRIDTDKEFYEDAYIMRR